jgi:lipopolysaccharide cholinephosphotransferase
MEREYTQEELRRVHAELYSILAEIIRVCEKCGIPYFIQGGSAIGAFFENAILPWDDDIDIGMTRKNYKRFLREAPKVLGPEYFLQWVGCDPHTPFYFAKVRKNNTLFVENDFAKLDIHNGIFIDVFPYDKVPDNIILQKFHRILSNFFNCCFMGKDIWMWKHLGKCQIKNPTNRGAIPCFFNRLVDILFTKKAIYRMLSVVQGMFNSWNTKYYNMVLMPKDHISVKSIENLQKIKFGDLTVSAPSDLETYLRHHYSNLRRYIPKEEQQNHRPTYLSFDLEKDQKLKTFFRR